MSGGIKVKKHRYLFLLLGLFTLFFILTACGGDSDSNQAEPNNTNNGEPDNDDAGNDNSDSDNNASSEGDGGKTLIFGRGSDSISLDAAIPTDGESIYVTNQIYDTLVRYEEESTEVKPALATDWEVSDDNLVWTFQLRDDVTFHDGNEFTAEDVVYNFERWTTSSEFFYYGYMFGDTADKMK